MYGSGHDTGYTVKGAVMSEEKKTIRQEKTETTENETLAEGIGEKARNREEAQAAGEKKESYVYCGPSVRGVARQYTVYSGETPELLEAFVKEHPTAKALIVPVSRFAETRRKLETAGTAEALLYKQIRSEM